jgi:hypothetical protein
VPYLHLFRVLFALVIGFWRDDGGKIGLFVFNITGPGPLFYLNLPSEYVDKCLFDVKICLFVKGYKMFFKKNKAPEDTQQTICDETQETSCQETQQAALDATHQEADLEGTQETSWEETQQAALDATHQASWEETQQAALDATHQEADLEDTQETESEVSLDESDESVTFQDN